MGIYTLIFAAMAFVLCALPWGSYGWMGKVGYQELTPEEVEEKSPAFVLDHDIEMSCFGNMYKVKAGAEMRVLG